MRKTLLALLLASWPNLVWANCGTTYNFKDGAGATQAGCAHTDGGGATLIPNSNIVDVTGTNQWGIDASNRGKVDLSSIGANAAVTGGVVGSLGVGGVAASGTAVAGNPVLQGLSFATTQPTVTTGQAVTWQGTARGAGIVATGVDPLVATLGAGTAIAGKFGIDQTTPGTTNGVVLNASTAIAGKFGIDQTTPGTTNGVVLNASTAIAGKFGIDQTTPGTTNAIQEIPGTTGGTSWFFLQPTNTDNHTTIKNGTTNVYQIVVENNSAVVNYLRFYNAGTGFNGCNSATNIAGQFQIPAATSVGGIVIPIPGGGTTLATGLSICVTSGYATTDVTAATASAISLNIFYK